MSNPSSKLHLKPAPTLADLQQYVRDMVAERGFDKNEDIAKKFMLLIEEVGEFAKAVRATGVLHMADDSAQTNVQLEAADVFIVLLGVCNLLGIDLEAAFRTKEAINKTRTWRSPAPKGKA